MASNWTGPVPPPAILQQFNDVVENGAERIFQQFELENAHRRKQENRNVRLQIWGNHIGQALAALYAGGAFGVYAIAYNAPWVAAVLGGGTIAYRTAARGFRQIDAMTRGSCLSSTNVHGGCLLAWASYLTET